MPFHELVAGTLAFASIDSGTTVWNRTVPLVGCVQKTWPSQVMSRPQVLPPRLLVLLERAAVGPEAHDAASVASEILRPVG